MLLMGLWLILQGIWFTKDLVSVCYYFHSTSFKYTTSFWSENDVVYRDGSGTTNGVRKKLEQNLKKRIKHSR